MSAALTSVQFICEAAAYAGGALIVSAIFPVVSPIVAVAVGSTAFLTSSVFKNIVMAIIFKADYSKETTGKIYAFMYCFSPIVACGILLAAFAALSIPAPLVPLLVGAAIVTGLIIATGAIQGCCCS